MTPRERRAEAERKIDELIEYFEGLEIKGPIKLNLWTTITDTKLFISANLKRIAVKNTSSPVVRASYRLLNELKTIIENDKDFHTIQKESR